MILYTMMPQELIFPYESHSNAKQLTVTYQGIPLLVELTDRHDVQVVRVLSTNPQHFMDSTINPGSKISLANIEGLSAF